MVNRGEGLGQNGYESGKKWKKLLAVGAVAASVFNVWACSEQDPQDSPAPVAVETSFPAKPATVAPTPDKHPTSIATASATPHESSTRTATPRATAPETIPPSGPEPISAGEVSEALEESDNQAWVVQGGVYAAETDEGADVAVNPYVVMDDDHDGEGSVGCSRVGEVKPIDDALEAVAFDETTGKPYRVPDGALVYRVNGEKLGEGKTPKVVCIKVDGNPETDPTSLGRDRWKKIKDSDGKEAWVPTGGDFSTDKSGGRKTLFDTNDGSPDSAKVGLGVKKSIPLNGSSPDKTTIRRAARADY